MTANSTLQQEILEAIRNTALEVFSTMLALEITPGEPIISREGGENHYSLIALLGLTGAWFGSGQISCEPEFACQMASRMLMAEYGSVDDDVLDAFAEIANMIVGNIKNALELRLGPMGLSTPTIIFGGDFETRVAGSPDRVIMPFASSHGPLVVQIVLAPKHATDRVRDRHRGVQLAAAD